jgi:hypothetical protein
MPVENAMNETTMLAGTRKAGATTLTDVRHARERLRVADLTWVTDEQCLSRLGSTLRRMTLLDVSSRI